jgi:hypothetical protein
MRDASGAMRVVFHTENGQVNRLTIYRDRESFTGSAPALYRTGTDAPSAAFARTPAFTERTFDG